VPSFTTTVNTTDQAPDDAVIHPTGFILTPYFLPARRYASADNSDRNVSVCLSVRLSRAGIVSKRRKLAA